MKNVIRKTAVLVVFAAALWPAARVQAACTTGWGDTSNPDCATARKCQKAILGAAIGYTAAVQKIGSGFITDGQAGSLNSLSTVAPMHCVGGDYPGQGCAFNNGVCKGGTNASKGNSCSSDPDCGASAKAGTCNRGKGAACNAAAINDNVGQCQVNPAKAKYAKDVASNQTKLSAAIKKACDGIVDPADIGLSNIAGCPGIASAATTTDAYQALADCLTASTDGDLKSGGTVETLLRPLALSTGTGKLAPSSKANKAPRLILQLAGSTALQIGNGIGDPTSNNQVPAGGLTLLALASCRHCSTTTAAGCVVNGDCPGVETCVSTGNGNVSCINNADCGTDTSGAAGTCTADRVIGSATQLHAPQPVFDPADPTSLGNTLTQSATCANATATCLITHTKNSGNGTASTGSINLTTGAYTSASPVITDVYVTGLGVDCTSFKACPVCQGGVCSNNGSALCTAAEGSVTPECPPSGGTTIHIPNPFNLTTAGTILTPAPGAPAGVFCGRCTGDSTVGCQTATDCTNFGTTAPCVFSDGTDAPGFHGDTSVTVISAPGTASTYAPAASGVFCTGKTGNATVNGSAGLPGPVRSINPYLFGYVQTKD